MKPRLLLSSVLILSLLPLRGQPRWILGVNGGYYEPTLTGFDQNEQLPAPKFIATNVLYGLSLERSLFYNSRLSYTGFTSRHSGTTQSGAAFVRKLHYRMLFVQTYYWPWRRIEFNFQLGAVFGQGLIALDTKNASTDWDALLSSYGNNSISLSSTDKMTTWWLGTASTFGVRYYLFSWLALDLKVGFMHNGYSRSKWKFQGKTVSGPALDLKRLPLFSLQVLTGW